MHLRHSSFAQVQTMLSWEDIRLICVLEEQGQVAQASAVLGVTPSTIYRRLNALEHQLGFPLFDRLPQGYSPMPSREPILAIARQMGALAQQLTDELKDSGDVVSGHVVIAAPDLIAPIVMTTLASLRRQHQGLSFELRLGVEASSLFKREADLALRVTYSPQEGLVGRSLAQVVFAPYALRQWWQARDPEAAAPWIVGDSSVAKSPIGRWEAAHVPQPQRALVLSSRSVIMQAILDGLGVGVLPCGLADEQPSLVRVGELLPAPHPSLWVLMHPELRHHARLRVVFDALVAEITRRRPMIQGQAGA